MTHGEAMVVFDELEPGDDVQVVADDGTQFSGTVDRRETTPEKNRFASVQNIRVFVDGDDGDFTIGAKAVHEPPSETYPGYDAVEDFHIDAAGETYGVDEIRTP